MTMGMGTGPKDDNISFRCLLITFYCTLDIYDIYEKDDYMALQPGRGLIPADAERNVYLFRAPKNECSPKKIHKYTQSSLVSTGPNPGTYV